MFHYMQYGEQYTVAPPCSCGILVKMFVKLCTHAVTPLNTNQTESRINLLISVHYSCLVIYYSRKLKIHTATLKFTAFGVCCFSRNKMSFCYCLSVPDFHNKIKRSNGLLNSPISGAHKHASTNTLAHTHSHMHTIIDLDYLGLRKHCTLTPISFSTGRG